MKIQKKSVEYLVREDAHWWSGGRKLLLNDNEVKNIQWMTYGFLPAGSKFEWHNHENINEVMYVIKWEWTIKDSDGIYTYKTWDFFIFKSGVFHEIENLSDEEHEYIFVRVHD